VPSGSSSPGVLGSEQEDWHPRRLEASEVMRCHACKQQLKEEQQSQAQNYIKYKINSNQSFLNLEVTT
jgi:hypothetical protein